MLSFSPASVLVIFLLVWILVIVLSKVFFRPVRKVMGERESMVRSDEEAGEKALREAEENLRQIQESVRSAALRADALRQEMESEALKEKNRLLAEVGQACRDRAEEAKKQLEEEVELSRKELKARAEELSETIEKRLLQ